MIRLIFGNGAIITSVANYKIFSAEKCQAEKN